MELHDILTKIHQMTPSELEQNALLLLEPQVPNFNCFILLLAVFELHAILRQVHQMTQNDLEHHMRSKVSHTCSTTARPNTKYEPVLLYD